MSSDYPSYLPRRIQVRILVCFLLSGATGLIYEVLWMRMLGLIFGHTVFAITTVLTAFMAGLGLGSYLFGKIADRSRNSLLLYGLLEGGIGLYALAIPFLLALAEKLYLALYQLLHLSHYAFSLTQFILLFLLLLLPTTMMGATLPVLSRLFVVEEATLGRQVGFLYALNTFGAVLGVASAGYFLLPHFGTRGTLYLAAIVNLGIAGLIIYWSRFILSPSLPFTPDSTGDRQRGILLPLVLLGIGLSGVASMIYEVAWSRALALIIGSSTYAFTAMLVAFLVGIALGSALFSRFWGARPVHPSLFGALQTAIGLSALLMLPAFGAMPDLFLQTFRISNAPGFIQTAQFLTSFAAMILPTLLIGATFPCVVRIAAWRPDRVGTDVGGIYAVNTLGAVIGAFAAGFLLIPSVGAHATVKLGILLNLGMGLAFTLVSVKALPAMRWLPWTLLSGAALGGVYWIPAWDRVAMSSGVAIYGPQLTGTAGKVGLSNAVTDDVLFYEDGISATVTIHRSNNQTFLRVNGKTDASTGIDMHTQLLSGHLPLLFHPAPKSVLIIGLGSGVTAGAVARHPVERIDVIEIEPAVVRASRFFEKENRGVLKDPRVLVIIADGRNFLLTTTERYDVIISEPSNPWIGGLASLFSREFFALAKQKLKPGGVMLQWVQGYGLAPSDMKMVIKTFRTAFPATTVWNTNGGDYLLLGVEKFLPIDLNKLQIQFTTMVGLREDLNGIGLRSASALLSDFVLGEEDVERYASGAPINTDDLLPLEFSAPLSLYFDTTQLNYQIMKGYKTRELPGMVNSSHSGPSQLDSAEARFDLGVRYLAKGLHVEAISQFEKALATDPSHHQARLQLGRAQLHVNLPLKAVGNFEAVLKQNPRDPEAMYQLAIAYQAQQLPDRALEYFSKAVALTPENPLYRTRLAALFRERGRLDEAVAHYRAAQLLKPKDPAILEGLGITYLQYGQAGQAIQLFNEALAVDSARRSRYSYHLGQAYLVAGQFKEAVETLLLATQYAPLSVDALVDLSTAYTYQGQMDKAAQSLRKALLLDPYHSAIQRLRTRAAAPTKSNQSAPENATHPKP